MRRVRFFFGVVANVEVCQSEGRVRGEGGVRVEGLGGGWWVEVGLGVEVEGSEA